MLLKKYENNIIKVYNTRKMYIQEVLYNFHRFNTMDKTSGAHSKYVQQFYWKNCQMANQCFL